MKEAVLGVNPTLVIDRLAEPHSTHLSNGSTLEVSSQMSYRHKALAREPDTQQRPNKRQLSSVAETSKEIFEKLAIPLEKKSPNHSKEEGNFLENLSKFNSTNIY